jgi:hypothetical protein
LFLSSKIHYSCLNALDDLNLHTLFTARRHLHTTFLVNVYNDLKFRRPLPETAGICVLILNFRAFSLFIADSSYKICPCSTCISDAIAVFRDIDIFKNLVTLNHV